MSTQTGPESHQADPDGTASRYRIMPDLVQGRFPTLIVTIVLAILSAAATLLLPLAAAGLVSAMQAESSVTGWALAIVGLGVVATITGACSSYLLARAAEQLIMRLRVRAMRHAFRSGIRDVERVGPGDLVARLTADAANIKRVIDVGPVQLPMAVLVLTGTVIIMAILDWVLLLITLGAFVFAIGAVGVVVILMRRNFSSLQTALGGLSERFVAALDCLPIIKAYRAEESTLAELANEADDVRRIELRLSRYECLLAPLVNFGQQIALVSVLIGGGARLVAGQLELGAFVAFLMYLLQLAAPLMIAVTGYAGIQAGLAARDRFSSVFSLPEEGDGPSVDEAAPREVSSAVRFDGVDFAYEADTPVLNGVTLRVPSRGITAIVGASGAGKSTILGLIEGFEVPDNGTLEILGHHHNAWSLDARRQQVAYLDQKFTLLRTTVRENLTLGRSSDASPSELVDALDRVGMREAIELLPEGLETVIGRGTDLSGGQRQRLALARLLLTDRPLVLLDEPSSQLDSLSEGRLLEVIAELARRSAVAVVAHRSSIIRQADHLVVLDAGRVVAEGRPDEVQRTSEAYASLVGGPSPADELAGV